MDTAPGTENLNLGKAKNNKAKLLTIITLVVVALLGFVAYQRFSLTLIDKSTWQDNNQSQEDSLVLLPTPAPGPEISFEPDELSLKVGSEFNSNIAIDTLEHGITAIKLVLQFNPAFIVVQDIIPGDFFNSPTVLTKKIDNVKGTVRLDLGVIKPVRGTGEVAKLTGIALKKTENPTQIVFSTDTEASGISADGNINSENILKSYLSQDLIIEL